MAAKSPIAITLPTADTRGHHGFTASSAAVATSTTPRSDENAVTENTSYTQLKNGLLATSGWMPCASNDVNLSRPIHPITRTRPYRASAPPRRAIRP